MGNEDIERRAKQWRNKQDFRGGIAIDGVDVTATAAELNAAVAGVLPEAADVPIDDDAELFTAEDVEAALAEVKAIADAAYPEPVGGIPLEDLEDDVQTSLGKADTAMQGSADVTDIRGATIALNGKNPTYVGFGADQIAEVTGDEEGPFDLSANGLTVIVTPDAEAQETFTFTFTQGKHESGANPTADISGGVDDRFLISIDGADPEAVVLTLGNCDTEAHTADEMQTKIRALASGQGADVTVAFAATKFTITSPKLGTGSSVVVTDSPNKNIAEELKLGTTNGGVSTAGMGPAADATEVTAQEIVDYINDEATNLEAVVVEGVAAGYVKLLSLTEGGASVLTMGNGTANTALGFTNTEVFYGKAGMGYETGMADTAYIVTATINGTAQAQLAGKCISVSNKETTGFRINCETAAATDNVDVIVIGKAVAS